jgi:hypothetical protein
MMADAQAGKLDLVATWRFDRFARSTCDLLDALDSFQTWGIENVKTFLQNGLRTTGLSSALLFGSRLFARDLRRCVNSRHMYIMEYMHSLGHIVGEARSGRSIGMEPNKVLGEIVGCWGERDLEIFVRDRKGDLQ